MRYLVGLHGFFRGLLEAASVIGLEGQLGEIARGKRDTLVLGASEGGAGNDSAYG